MALPTAAPLKAPVRKPPKMSARPPIAVPTPGQIAVPIAAPVAPVFAAAIPPVTAPMPPQVLVAIGFNLTFAEPQLGHDVLHTVFSFSVDAHIGCGNQSSEHLKIDVKGGTFLVEDRIWHDNRTSAVLAECIQS